MFKCYSRITNKNNIMRAHKKANAKFAFYKMQQTYFLIARLQNG